MSLECLLLDLDEALVVFAGVVGQELVQVHLLLLVLLLSISVTARGVLSQHVREAGGGAVRIVVTQRLLGRLKGGGAGQAACTRPNTAILLLKCI